MATIFWDLWSCGWAKYLVAGRCRSGITNPGLVPESRNEAGVAWIGDVPLTRASRAYFAAGS